MKLSGTIIYIFASMITLLACNDREPSYSTFRNIEFAWIGKPYDGNIYVNNFDSIDLAELIEFTYCLTLTANLKGLIIKNKYYYSEEREYNFLRGDISSVFIIEISETTSQISEAQVNTSKVIKYVKYLENGNLDIVPEDKVPINLNCY